MRKRLHIVLVLDVFGNIERIFAGTAACTVCHADKSRVQLGDLLRRFFDTVKGRVLLRRENFKGQRKGFLLECMNQFHMRMPPDHIVIF